MICCGSHFSTSGSSVVNLFLLECYPCDVVLWALGDQHQLPKWCHFYGLHSTFYILHWFDNNVYFHEQLQVLSSVQSHVVITSLQIYERLFKIFGSEKGLVSSMIHMIWTWVLFLAGARLISWTLISMNSNVDKNDLTVIFHCLQPLADSLIFYFLLDTFVLCDFPDNFLVK